MAEKSTGLEGKESWALFPTLPFTNSVALGCSLSSLGSDVLNVYNEGDAPDEDF